MVTFLSKYFSSANENKNNEKIEIKIEGINVNNEKYVIYFLLDVRPSLSISIFIDLFISIKINVNNRKSKKILRINKYFKLSSVNSIKLLLIKVKNVKNPINNVILDKIIMKIFFFKKSNMI